MYMHALNVQYNYACACRYMRALVHVQRAVKINATTITSTLLCTSPQCNSIFFSFMSHVFSKSTSTDFLSLCTADSVAFGSLHPMNHLLLAKTFQRPGHSEGISYPNSNFSKSPSALESEDLCHCYEREPFMQNMNSLFSLPPSPYTNIHLKFCGIYSTYKNNIFLITFSAQSSQTIITEWLTVTQQKCLSPTKLGIESKRHQPPCHVLHLSSNSTLIVFP